jgi:hypothetical protein
MFHYIKNTAKNSVIIKLIVFVKRKKKDGLKPGYKRWEVGCLASYPIPKKTHSYTGDVDPYSPVSSHHHRKFIGRKYLCKYYIKM